MGRVNTTWDQVTEAYSQYRHTHCKPEILLAENVLYAQVPGLSLSVVQVFENGKGPWRTTISM